MSFQKGPLGRSHRRLHRLPGPAPDFAFWPRLLRAALAASCAEFPAAAADFAEALRLADDDLQRAAVRFSRSVFYLRQQDRDNALADLQEAIRLQPDAYQGYATLGQLHQDRKDWDEAAKALSRAIDLRNTDSGLYFTRARVHVMRKDWAAARDDLKKVIQLEPEGTSLRLAGVAWSWPTCCIRTAPTTSP